MPHISTQTVLIFALAMATGATAGRAAEIRIKPQATVASPLVVLGDVADVSSPDEEQAALLRNVELFPSPSPGSLRRLTAREVYEILELSRVDLAGCRFTGARLTLVQGGAKPMVQAKPEAPKPAEPKISQASLETTEPPAPPEPVETVVVAARSLTRGDLVTPGDVKIAPAPGGARLADAAKTLEEVMGMEVSRPIAAGRAVLAASVQPPILVRRGDNVQVVARLGGASVRTVARATENGALGDIVYVQRPEDRQEYPVKITASQQAEVVLDFTSTKKR